ncbi:MAG: CRISPR-associated protein Cas4 [Elusimicrobiales bacterium]
MYSDEELLPLSALQHFIFCRRQCALIHIEQSWTENAHTAEGRVMHERAHDEGHQTLPGVRVERGLALVSRELGLSGKADIVEFRDGGTGVPVVFPVEYKRGRQKSDDCDNVQLCAQALCLEEMLKTAIPSGAIFYGKVRRRHEVQFTAQLREKTIETARLLHEFISTAATPKPCYCPQCQACSFIGVCLPKTMYAAKPVAGYFNEALADL